MIAERMNPYRPPASVEADVVPEVDDEGRRHHLSNRTMSIVLGLVGGLLLFAGLFFLATASGPRMPAGLVVPFSFCGSVATVLGMAAVSVAIFLWRYDAS